MDNLKEYDLVIYDHGNKHFCLGRIVKITPFTSEGINAYWVEVQDIKMLSNDSTYDNFINDLYRSESLNHKTDIIYKLGARKGVLQPIRHLEIWFKNDTVSKYEIR